MKSIRVFWVLAVSVPMIVFSSCGEKIGSVRGATVETVAGALNQSAPQLDIPGTGTTGGALRALVAIDDRNPAIGAPGANFSWILDVSEQFAQILTSFSEGIFFQQDDGTASMLSTIVENITAGVTSFGPHEIIDAGEDTLFVGVMFNAFIGCASDDGALHTDPSADNPLSMTVFMGGAADAMTRMASVCVTSIEPLVGEAWLDPTVFFGLQAGLETPDEMGIHLEVDIGDAGENCPYADSNFYTTQMFKSAGGGSDFAEAPNDLAGAICLNADNNDEFLVAANMLFDDPVDAGPCMSMDDLLVNLATDGSEVAGKIQFTLGGVTPTSNGSAGCPPAAQFNSFMSSAAEGLCANSSGSLQSAADCSVDDNATLLTDVDASGAEAAATFPADAPSTFVSGS